MTFTSTDENSEAWCRLCYLRPFLSLSQFFLFYFITVVLLLFYSRSIVVQFTTIWGYYSLQKLLKDNKFQRWSGYLSTAYSQLSLLRTLWGEPYTLLPHDSKGRLALKASAAANKEVVPFSCVFLHV